MNKFDNIAIKRILRKMKISYNSELGKILGFYKTILELERSKEPDIVSFYQYDLHFKDDDSNVILLDMPCNVSFTKAFLDNKDLTFPKDLFVGLPIIRKDRSGQIIAFGVTIDYDDLRGFDPYENLLPIKISNLTLDARHFDELGLTVESVDEIEREIAKTKSISDLQQLVAKYFGESTELKLELQVSLSSKNIALAQISAELNKLSVEMVKRNDLLEHFLSHTEFSNLIENVSVDELIPVSTLDESQASVVAHALSNKFSVVTGAPGTGKTQVILNIIANALMRDKSVLIASKNNKAVDNVKERFDLVDQSHYLIRFGKKEYVRNQTIPALSHILNRLNSLQNQPNNLSSLLIQYKNTTSAICGAKKKLAKIDELKDALPKFIADISAIEKRISEENQRFNVKSQDIKSKFSEVFQFEDLHKGKIDSLLSSLRRQRNSHIRKYSGLRGIWNNLFSKKKDAERFLNRVEELPSTVKSVLRKKGLKDSIVDYSNGEAIVKDESLVIALLEEISEFLHEKEKEDSRHSKTVSNLESTKFNYEEKLKTATAELELLTAKKSELICLINRSKNTLVELGPQLIEAKINEIERLHGASGKISLYKSYLPDNIPWKDTELPGFIRKSRDFLSICRLVSVTSLSVKAGFPLIDGLFDILVIDEASQCDVASALPLILRAKQVVVIGDPNQLRHITSVKPDEENAVREHLGLSNRPYLKYVEQSLWDYSADFLALANQNSSTVTLENHYRCHHDIIGYSNHQFYEHSLDKPLEVKTDETKMTLPQRGMVMINIRGQQESANININRIEVDRCVSLAKELCTLKADVSIGIVTPFRDQADYIKSRIDDSIKDNVEVNTAHGFQGDEKDVIIYSLVVTNNSPKSKINWIDYMVPNLVNVAVTRARQTLYVVGNADYIKSVSSERNALGYLIRYAQSKTK